MDKVRIKGTNFNENRNSSCCRWSRSLIYIIKLTYLVGLSNTWNLYKMVCKRPCNWYVNLIINGMVKGCLDCFVVFNLVLACAGLAIRALDKRLRKKALQQWKSERLPRPLSQRPFLASKYVASHAGVFRGARLSSLKRSVWEATKCAV